MLVYLNGEFLPKAEARLPVDDRGFLFGDGIYEVTRAVDGRLFEVDRHLARMRGGATAIKLALPDDMEAQLLAVWERLLVENGLTHGDAMVYLQITRGAAPRLHQFPPAGTPLTVFASASAITPPDALRARGAAVITMPDLRWGRCDIKSINLLPNVLGKQAAAEAGAFESVFIRDGEVTEGAQTSVFGVIDGELRTHPLTNQILPSITRAVVLELAQAIGVPAREVAFDEGDLRTIDELFVASTTSDVLPVVTVDGRTVGDGTPGPITRALSDAMQARLGRRGAALSAQRSALSSVER